MKIFKHGLNLSYIIHIRVMDLLMHLFEIFTIINYLVFVNLKFIM